MKRLDLWRGDLRLPLAFLSMFEKSLGTLLVLRETSGTTTAAIMRFTILNEYEKPLYVVEAIGVMTCPRLPRLLSLLVGWQIRNVPPKPCLFVWWV